MPAGRLQQVSDPTTWAQYTYDNRSRVTQTLYSNGVKSVYGYDSSGRTTALTHRNASNAIIIGYTASYDSAGRLGGVTENNGSATSYGYDFAGRLLSENRTGTNPYVSTYTYTNRGQRATAFRSENGVASHNGTYTYDDAGRLTNVADTVTTSGLGGSYTWNNDSTLASYPGPGYTRKLSYDEEGRLTKIDRDTAGTITPVFEYGYGFDGNRRWRKDLAGNTWDWYPCGVACCAGELVTLRSTNGGSSWGALATNLNLQQANFRAGNLEIQAQGAILKVGSGGTPMSFRRDRAGVVRVGIAQQTGSAMDPLVDEGLVNAGKGANLAELGINTAGGWDWTSPECIACLATKCPGMDGWLKYILCGLLCAKECQSKPAPVPVQPPVPTPGPGTCPAGYHWESVKCKGGSSFEGCVPNGFHRECDKNGNPLQLPDVMPK